MNLVFVLIGYFLLYVVLRKSIEEGVYLALKRYNNKDERNN